MGPVKNAGGAGGGADKVVAVGAGLESATVHQTGTHPVYHTHTHTHAAPTFHPGRSCCHVVCSAVL